VHIYDNIMFFFVEYLLEDGPEKAETRRRFTTCFYIVVPGHNAVVGILYLLKCKTRFFP